MTPVRRLILTVLFALFANVAAHAAPSWTASGEIPPEIDAGLVQVEVVLHSSDGEEPNAAGWRSRCPNCGNYHVSDVDDAIRDQRPIAVPGFLIAADRVVLADPVVDSRFVKEWRVRRGDETVPAQLAAYATDRRAIQLALDRPLPGARPLRFHTQGKGPYFVMSNTNGDDGFGTQLSPVGSSWVNKADGRRFLSVPSDAMIVAADGRPVTLTLREELPAGDGWKTDPARWPWLSAKSYSEKLATIRQAAGSAILRARIVYRQRATNPGENSESGYTGSDEREMPGTAVAVVLGPNRVLVLAALLPRQTAALESIQLAMPDGREIPATFIATVSEFGAFVAAPQEPLESALPVSTDSWHIQRERIVLALRVKVQGDSLELRPGHLRLAAIKPGLRGRAVPTFSANVSEHFIFDVDGRLLGLPIAPRPAINAERWRSEGSKFPLHVQELAQFTGDPAAFADLRNIPQSAEDEQRLAWIGVELQPLDPELAKVHGVAGQTDPGDGALVIHVYPDSPAARAGLQVGDVLLRIHVSGAAEPVAVNVSSGRYVLDPFPWDQYDELPEPYYDQVPAPWQPAENDLAGLLKDIGFGAEYQLDFARDAKVSSIKLVVDAGPVHYATAAQADEPALGLTARELSFETRRYFQIPAGEPGMLIARVLPGSRASSAGLKPFEIVVAINDQPVRTATEFAAAVKSSATLTMSVRRMHKSRVVTFAPSMASASE